MSYLQDILLENRKPKERLKQIEELLEINIEGTDSDEFVRS